jgi:hypothetical protein
MEKDTKKKSMYEISHDLLALNDLLDSLVDEDGNPRDPTEDEQKTMAEWFQLSYEDFQKKFDSYCKFIKNQKIAADVAEGERKAFKDEMDRLSKRAKAYENRAKNLTSLLLWNMTIIKTPKFKTELFSAYTQDGQISIGFLNGSTLKNVPEEYLKPRELDTAKIKQAIKDGVLICGKDLPNHTPLQETKIFDKESGKEIPDIFWSKTPFLVIR